MDLYFSRRRIFETSLYMPCAKNTQDGFSDFKEIYRLSTTVRKLSITPDVTTIKYVGTEDKDKHYTVATIKWRWPSQKSSRIEIDGQRLALSDFMKKESGLNKTDTNVMFEDEQYTWRSGVFRTTRLFDSRNRPVAHYTSQAKGLRPINRAIIIGPGCLHLEPELAENAHARNLAVASFFAYKASRDVSAISTPWWRDEEASFTGVRLKEGRHGSSKVYE